MTLEDLLNTKVKTAFGEDIVPNFRVAVQNITPDEVHFIIHPMDYDGATLDFICSGNSLIPR
jgi:hypothetical protein